MANREVRKRSDRRRGFPALRTPPRTAAICCSDFGSDFGTARAAAAQAARAIRAVGLVGSLPLTLLLLRDGVKEERAPPAPPEGAPPPAPARQSDAPAA